jgi:hypothetical protein
MEKQRIGVLTGGGDCAGLIKNTTQGEVRQELDELEKYRDDCSDLFVVTACNCISGCMRWLTGKTNLKASGVIKLSNFAKEAVNKEHFTGVYLFYKVWPE